MKKILRGCLITSACEEIFRTYMYLVIKTIVNCNLFTHEAFRSSYELVFKTCLTVLSRLNWNLEMPVFEKRRKTSWSKKENQQQTQQQQNNKLNYPHMASTPGSETLFMFMQKMFV